VYLTFQSMKRALFASVKKKKESNRRKRKLRPISAYSSKVSTRFNLETMMKN
jgi:hypothetical protein